MNSERKNMSKDYPLYDKQSGRFYKVAGKNKTIIEYEPEIKTTRGTFSESEYRSLEIKTPSKPAVLHVSKFTCPFSKYGNKCTEEKCSFYGENGCLTSHGSECLGRRCPLNTSACHTACALYMDGCILCKERKSNEK